VNRRNQDPEQWCLVARVDVAAMLLPMCDRSLGDVSEAIPCGGRLLDPRGHVESRRRFLSLGHEWAPLGADVPPRTLPPVHGGRGSDDERPRAPSAPDLPDDLSTLRDVGPDLPALELQQHHLVGLDLSGRDATSLALIEACLEDVDASGANLRRASLRDVIVERGDCANADLSEAILKRVEVRGVRLTGVILGGARLEDVTFAGCRLDLSSFRFGHLEAVRFDDCRMEEADLYQAALTSVDFSSCDLSRTNLAEATFERCEMRDCELTGVAGSERLRGVAMPWPDVVRSAAVLASGLGVRILEDD
jgi:uncharacterized protein YjbI with pentapeptide repeats